MHNKYFHFSLICFQILKFKSYFSKLIFRKVQDIHSRASISQNFFLTYQNIFSFISVSDIFFSGLFCFFFWCCQKVICNLEQELVCKNDNTLLQSTKIYFVCKRKNKFRIQKHYWIFCITFLFFISFLLLFSRVWN